MNRLNGSNGTNGALKNGASGLLGPSGRPWRDEIEDLAETLELDGARGGIGPKGPFVRFFSGASYHDALRGVGSSAATRAQDPFGNHPWVFAAAQAIALAASQAPYRVFRETDAAVEGRRRLAKRAGRTFRRRAGSSRTFVERNLSIGTTARILSRGLEPDFEHPANDLLRRPNPMLDANGFQYLVFVWLAVRGEVFILKTDEDGFPTEDTRPARLYPISPDLFSPRHEYGDSGELVGWELKLPKWLPNARSPWQRMTVPVGAVIHPKYSDPACPFRGLSPLSPAAQAIHVDLLARGYNRDLIANKATPDGLIVGNEETTQDEIQAARADFESRHRGEGRHGRLGTLWGGIQYVPVSLTPSDLQYLELLKTNREEVLASIGTPRSVLGVTETVNLATALAQDKTFWERTVIPLMRISESAFDAGLFFEDLDDVSGAYDLNDVEALRAGVAEKVAEARNLAGSELHLPPRVAFEVVGLEVPEYPADDVCLVPGALFPAEEIAQGIGDLDDETEPEDDEDLDDDELEDELEDDDDQGDADELEAEAARLERELVGELQVEPARAAAIATIVRAAKSGVLSDPFYTLRDGQTIPRRARKILGDRLRRLYRGPELKGSGGPRWREFLRLEQVLEVAYRNRYRRWVRDVEEQTLEAFDRLVVSSRASLTRDRVVKNDEAQVIELVFDIDDARTRLKETIRPLYQRALESTWEFTLADLGGVAVFEIDDPRMIRFFDQRERKLLGTMPVTIQRNIRASMREGFRANEPLHLLRGRIQTVMDNAASTPKAISVARTETAGFMNGARDVMFEAGGFVEVEWITAADEVVRDAHVVYGNLPPQPRGTNYLRYRPADLKPFLTEADGRLRYPGDLEAPAAEVVNCRCTQIPTR